jgi:hypothetical protein
VEIQVWARRHSGYLPTKMALTPAHNEVRYLRHSGTKAVTMVGSYIADLELELQILEWG